MLGRVRMLKRAWGKREALKLEGKVRIDEEIEQSGVPLFSQSHT